jgi:hypothetical protein
MIYAIVNWTWKFEHHKRDRGFFDFILHSNGTSALINEPSVKPLLFFIHGWMLWIAWGILGFVQIATNRYFKPYFKICNWLHIISGIAIFMITVI